MSTQYHSKSSRKSQSEADPTDDEAALAAWASNVPIPTWDAGLRCRVFSTEFDAETQTGTIAIQWGDAADMTGAIRKFSSAHPRVARVNVDWQSAYGQRRRDVSYIMADDEFDDEGDLLPFIDDEPWRMIDRRDYVPADDMDELISLNNGRHIQ